MCDCSQCSGIPFVFSEIDRTIKPCLNLKNLNDTQNLLSVLELINMNPGFFAINGCKSALLCVSISDLITWRLDSSQAPSPDAALVASLLLPQAALEQIPPISNHSNC